MKDYTYNQDGIECPYCNYVNKPDDASDYDEDTNAQWCGSCDKEFTTSCFVTHSWTSEPIDREDD